MASRQSKHNGNKYRQASINHQAAADADASRAAADAMAPVLMLIQYYLLAALARLPAASSLIGPAGDGIRLPLVRTDDRLTWFKLIVDHVIGRIEHTYRTNNLELAFDACWFMPASTNGYTSFNVNHASSASAEHNANRHSFHRILFCLVHDRQYDPSLEIAHRCHNGKFGDGRPYSCVNPAHLFEVAPSINADQNKCRYAEPGRCRHEPICLQMHRTTGLPLNLHAG